MAKRRTRVSVVVVHNEKLLCFRAVDPLSGRDYFFIPGGQIEAYETAPEAGERECLEETGYAINVDPATCIDQEYQFNWNGEDYDCLTLFYRGYLKSPMQVSLSHQEPEYNKGVAWVALEALDDVFNYNETIRNVVKDLTSL